MEKLKTINIKGREYVQVAERIRYFNETYPNGAIQTELVSDIGGAVTIKAKVTPDASKPERYFTGYSQAVKGDGMVNRTAHLENCETSAIGRALGIMGIGILDSIASVDEMVKAGAWKPESGMSYSERKEKNAVMDSEEL